LGTVTNVKKIDKNRYEIVIDDETSFTVHEDILLKYGLWQGKKLDASVMEAISAENHQHTAYLYALRYLATRPRTSSETARFLKQKAFPAHAIEQVIAKLREQGYINDQQFAKQWVDERIRLKPRGRRFIRYELLKKGVGANMADEALAMVNDETEAMAALALAKKKFAGKSQLQALELKRKAVAYLQRKGFSSQAIRYALRELFAQKGDFS
jgi:regulatory protein